MALNTLFQAPGAGGTPAPDGVPFAAVMSDVRAAIAEDLRPHLSKIDVEGWYPKPFMQRLGAVGGYAQAVPAEYGGAGRGLPYTLHVMEEVSQDDLSTGFCVWCQTVCAWYIQTSDNDILKQTLLPRVARGELLGGTGLSNPMKHFAGIEKMRLTATRRPGGYSLAGALPWVSNVAVDHVFAAVAKIAGEDGYLMAIIPGDSKGLTLGDGGHFIALEGSSTHNAVFRDVFVSEDFVLASPCHDYITRIRPGFILGQTGFGLGLVSSCLDLMRRSNERVGHVNCFLQDGVAEIEADLEETRRRVYPLAEAIGCGRRTLPPEAMREAVQARALTSELALRAAQAAMLHAGAAGYRSGSVAERKVRESYFVAVVTPALKHLKKLLHDTSALAPI